MNNKIKHGGVKFFDCKDGTIINLEHIVFVDTDERLIEFSNGVKIHYNPELFESIILKIRECIV